MVIQRANSLLIFLSASVYSDWHSDCIFVVIRLSAKISFGGAVLANDQAINAEVFEIQKENAMLSWALTFLVLAIIAAIFGFGGIAAGAASIAKILFFVFLVLFVVSLISNAVRGRSVA